MSVPPAGSGISWKHHSQCLSGRSHQQGSIQLHQVQFRSFKGQKHHTRISSQNPNLLLLSPLREMFSLTAVSSRVKLLKLPSLLPEVQVKHLAQAAPACTAQGHPSGSDPLEVAASNLSPHQDEVSESFCVCLSIPQLQKVVKSC